MYKIYQVYFDDGSYCYEELTAFDLIPQTSKFLIRKG